MWKLLTSMISDILYEHLAKQDLLPWEQKGCTRGGRGTKEQLVIDKTMMKDSRARSTNISKGWIDYKKAYDMVPHTRIDESYGDDSSNINTEEGYTWICV